MSERTIQPWNHYTPTNHTQTATGTTIKDGKLVEFREYQGKKSGKLNISYRTAKTPANNPFAAVSGSLQSQYTGPMPGLDAPGTKPEDFGDYSSFLSFYKNQGINGPNPIPGGNAANLNTGTATGFVQHYEYDVGGAPGGSIPSVQGTNTNPNAVLANQPPNTNTVTQPVNTITTTPSVSPDAAVIQGGGSAKPATMSPVVILAILAAVYLVL